MIFPGTYFVIYSQYRLKYNDIINQIFIKSTVEKEDKVMAKNTRFEKVYTQGAVNVTEIWVDKDTGVNYLYHVSGYSGGLTPLLDREGKPVISPVANR